MFRFINTFWLLVSVNVLPQNLPNFVFLPVVFKACFLFHVFLHLLYLSLCWQLDSCAVEGCLHLKEESTTVSKSTLL